MLWRIRGRERQVYGFTYDEYDRLTSADYVDYTDGGGKSNNNRFGAALTYDASGTKLRKIIKDGSMVLSTHDYVGGIEYKNNEVLEAIYHAEGRVYFEDGTNRYEYTIADHLGNARLAFTDKNGNGKVDQSDDPATNEVLQENHYYPFGMAMDGQWIGDPGRENKYRFNGKELNEDFGLNWYDPAIGRWNAVDPLATDFFALSPFAYTYNNPLLFIDPDGRSGEPVSDKENKQIIIYMNFNYYGNSSSLNDETVNAAASYLQSELNRRGSNTMGPDGNSYPVVFNVTASVVSVEEAKSLIKGNVGDNFDPRQNFVRLEDGVSPARNSTQRNLGFRSDGIQDGRSTSVRGGENSILLAPEHLTSTTWIHEVTAHWLNRESTE